MPESSNIVRVPCGDVELALHDFGGCGPILLLAHANGFPAMCYEPLARRLRDSYHCYGLDMRGQGDGPSSCGQPFVRYSQDIVATVRHLRAFGCYFFGHSGGGISGLMAVQAVPGLFKCMYVYDPPLYNPATTDTEGFDFDAGLQALTEICRRRRRTFSSRSEAARSFASKPPMSRFHSEALQAYVSHALLELPDGSVTLKCSPEVEIQVYQAVPEVMPNLYRNLERVECPLTFSTGHDVGANDFVGPHLQAAALRSPHSRLEMYKSLQHLGPFEDPDFVAGRVKATFLAASSLSSWARLPRDQTFESSKL